MNEKEVLRLSFSRDDNHRESPSVAVLLNSRRNVGPESDEGGRIRV